MAYKGQKYISKVMNRSGYVIDLPNVGVMKDLIQSHPINPYAESSTQLFPLGTKLTQGERVWRYCENASSILAIAVPIQSAARAHAAQDDDIVCGATAAVGTSKVSITSTTDLDDTPNDEADTFKEGYLIVNDEAGEGQCYKIKDAPALSGTNKTIFTLYDELTIELTGSSQLGLIQNPYKNVIVTATVLTAHCVGVTPLAVAADFFFWAQTGGPAAVVQGAATVALGTVAIVGTTVGKVTPGVNITTEIAIGYPLTPSATTDEYFIVFLTLDR